MNEDVVGRKLGALSAAGAEQRNFFGQRSRGVEALLGERITQEQ